MYGLDDFLNFVDALFHSGVFEYLVFHGGLCPLYVCVGGRGFVSYICKTDLCAPKKPFRGATKMKVRGPFGNFIVPPGSFCQVWWNA